MASRSSIASTTTTTTTMIARHLVARRGASGSCARPRCARPQFALALQRRPAGTPSTTTHRCYSTHTPYSADTTPPSSFAEKWQREYRAGVGLDSPDAAPTTTTTNTTTTNTTTTNTTTTNTTNTSTLAAQYHAHKQQQQQLGSLGADIGPHYQPHTLLTHPPSPADVTLELLLASEAHQGHATSLWNPANARYIHGIRQGIHIISLDATAAHLRRAAKVVHEVSRRAGIVLFVGTRDGHDRAVARAAELAKGCHLFERWIPGSITNGNQILAKCRTKVVNEHDVQVPGFEEQLYDRAVLKPDLVVCLNPLENYVLLHECALNNIPTIGVIDTNADPTWVTYPIPANDDSLRCIQVIAGVLGRAGEEGQKQRLRAAARGKITYTPASGLTIGGSEEAAQAARQKHDAEIANALAASRRSDSQQGGVLTDGEIAADAEFATHLDEVGNREDHRLKGGRRIKFSD